MIVWLMFYTQDRQDFQSCCFGKMMVSDEQPTVPLMICLGVK